MKYIDPNESYRNEYGIPDRWDQGEDVSDTINNFAFEIECCFHL